MIVSQNSWTFCTWLLGAAKDWLQHTGAPWPLVCSPLLEACLGSCQGWSYPRYSLPLFALWCPPPRSTVLAPGEPAPAPCYAPWVPGQALGLRPGWLLSCPILRLSLPRSPQSANMLPCSKHIRVPSPTLLSAWLDTPIWSPEFPPTGCVGSVLSTTRELELFFLLRQLLSMYSVKRDGMKVCIFWVPFQGMLFLAWDTLSQWQPLPPLSIWATLLHYSQMASEAASSAF